MTVSKFSLRKYHSLSLRLWHWSNSVVILGLLGTVLIRKTFLSWRANSVVIEEKLKATGNPITPELAKDIAVAIRDPLWDWHIYFGLILGALLLARILIALIIERKCPAIPAVRSIIDIKNIQIPERREALHFAFVKLGYVIFYLVTMLMVVTGLVLLYKTEIGLSKGFSGSIKELHELMVWFFVVFVAGHLVGIVVAENRTDPGIVSDMIHGGKPDAGEKH